MAQAAIAEVEQPLQPPPQDDLSSPEPRVPGSGRRPFTSKRYGPDREAPEEAQENFFQHLSSLSQTDWESHLVYVYQWDPIVDLTKGGKENKYRKLYSHAVTEESLKKELGSGTYNLRLNQLNQTTRKEKTVRQVMLNIFDPDYPPNLPPGGWLDDPRNKEWAWAKPLIEKKWAPAAVAATPTGVPEYMVQFMNEVRRESHQRPDMTTGAKDQLMGSIVTILPALLQQQNNASDPAKMIEALVKAKDMLMPVAVAPPVQDNTMMTFVLSQLTRLQESNDKLMGLLLSQKANENKPADPLAQVETMAKLIATVSGIVQPAAPKEWYQDLAETLGPKVVDLTSQIVTMNAMNARRPPNPAPVQHNPPQAHAPVQAQPTSAATQVIDLPPQPTPTETTSGEPEMDTMQRSMLINVAQLAAHALNLSLTGDQFAEQILYKFGQMVYDQFISNVPRDQLLTLMKSIPEAWSALAPFEAQLPEFIESFYSLPEQEDEDEPKSISQPEPTPVKVAKVKKSK